jgi:prevent-host-death family protein
VTKRYSVKDARANFSDVLGTVFYGQEAVIVERNGRPMAVLISPEQWERYQRSTKQQFFETVDQLQERNHDIDPVEAEREIAQAVEEVRRERNEQNRD